MIFPKITGQFSAFMLAVGLAAGLAFPAFAGGNVARPFHEGMPDTSVAGMVGSSASSMSMVGSVLRQAMGSSQGGVVVQEVSADSGGAPRLGPGGKLGRVRAAPLGLNGSMAENLRTLIVARMGPDSCVEVTDHRMLKSGAGFRAQCDQQGVFEIHQTRSQARVSVCLHGDLGADMCSE